MVFKIIFRLTARNMYCGHKYPLKLATVGQVWLNKFIVSVLGRQKREDCSKSKTSLHYLSKYTNKGLERWLTG